jgi:DNA-binding beta-propeller fold protein YncE
VDAGTGIITTVAGNGERDLSGNRNLFFRGDGGAATCATLKGPWKAIVDPNGNLFIADNGNNRIRRVAAATGIITTVAGNGEPGFSGDGGLATSASLNYPNGIALDANGNLFIVDNGNNRIRKVNGPFV